MSAPDRRRDFDRASQLLAGIDRHPTWIDNLVDHTVHQIHAYTDALAAQDEAFEQYYREAAQLAGAKLRHPAGKGRALPEHPSPTTNRSIWRDLIALIRNTIGHKAK